MHTAIGFQQSASTIARATLVVSSSLTIVESRCTTHPTDNQMVWISCLSENIHKDYILLYAIQNTVGFLHFLQSFCTLHCILHCMQFLSNFSFRIRIFLRFFCKTTSSLCRWKVFKLYKFKKQKSYDNEVWEIWRIWSFYNSINLSTTDA